ncbi:ubiquitin carboxyl-terminal hydrolase 12 [Chaetodon auriga]|uniref:ubiquitin carboxyl-terminal hydrolase 12 n=1 Tax=Chaetodon auriga TaxID=39042 RepID=UPI004032A52E
MNHDLVEMFREKLDRFPISDYHGLKSPGLTCYLNSVLQVLFMTEDFREAVQRCGSRDPTTIDAHLRKLFADLQTSIARTDHIIMNLGITNVYQQRDAAEYFEKILCLTSPEATEMFKGEVNHKATCLKCNERNDSATSFWVLPLAVEDWHRQTYSVERGLKTYFSGEDVCRGNKMYCMRCDRKRDADFGCEITQSPEILTLLLKRFSFDHKHGIYVKLDSKVEVPQTLHMEDCKYDLYALVHHFGTLTGGHYIAHIKSFETHEWYCFDDGLVKQIHTPFGAGRKSLSSYTAYLLMYRKVSRRPEKTDEGNQEVLQAPLDVEGDGSEREGALVPDHQLTDESCSGRENLKHSHGDVGKKMTQKFFKKMADFQGEVKNQLQEKMASIRSYKQTLLHTDTRGDGESFKPPLQTGPRWRLPHGGQKSHELDRQTEERRPEFNTRGHHTVQTVNEQTRETHMNIYAKPSVTDCSPTTNRVKSAADRQKMHRDVTQTVSMGKRSPDKAKPVPWRY